MIKFQKKLIKDLLNLQKKCEKANTTTSVKKSKKVVKKQPKKKTNLQLIEEARKYLKNAEKKSSKLTKRKPF